MIIKYENVRAKTLSFVTCGVSFVELKFVFGSSMMFPLLSPLQYSQVLLFVQLFNLLFLLFNR